MALAETCFAASGASAMDSFPSSCVFLHLPSPYSDVGNGNFGYNQHPRYPSRAIRQNPQGECTVSFLLVVCMGGEAATGFGMSCGSFPWLSLQEGGEDLVSFRHTSVNTEGPSLPPYWGFSVHPKERHIQTMVREPLRVFVFTELREAVLQETCDTAALSLQSCSLVQGCAGWAGAAAN